MKLKGTKNLSRERILDVAGNLFYRSGIRAIGVDTIVAQVGIAKTTLYDHFASKDDLIKAYLEEQDRIFWEYFDKALANHPHSPRQQILDVFENFEAMINSPESLGCPFLSAVGEFPDLEQPGHQVGLAHKQKVRSRFQTLAQAAGVKAPNLLADQLLLILDGAFASKRVFRSSDSPAAQLMVTARMLLDLHLALNVK